MNDLLCYSVLWVADLLLYKWPQGSDSGIGTICFPAVFSHLRICTVKGPVWVGNHCSCAERIWMRWIQREVLCMPAGLNKEKYNSVVLCADGSYWMIRAAEYKTQKNTNVLLKVLDKHISMCLRTQSAQNYCILWSVCVILYTAIWRRPFSQQL